MSCRRVRVCPVTREGSPPQMNLNASSQSDSNYFGIPEFGYNRMLNPNLAVGLTVYGNGGMNTDYPGGEISAQSEAGKAAAYYASIISHQHPDHDTDHWPPKGKAS